MRAFFLTVLLVAGCGSRWQHANPNRLEVDEVAEWFTKAALAGDRSTARMMMLEHHHMAQFSKAPLDQAAWDTEINKFLDAAALEGGEGDAEVEATVVKRTAVGPDVSEKLSKEIRVAIVKVTLTHGGRTHESPRPWMFIETDDGWKFSP